VLGGLFGSTLLASTAEPMAGGGAFIVLVVLGLVLLGSPLFVVIGGLALSCFAAFPVDPSTFDSFQNFATHVNLIEGVVQLGEKKELVAIPFFMIAGAIMSQGAIARRLVDVANACFGWLPGGLALSTIAACMFFAAISGSSPVTVITIGAIMLPALTAAGYSGNLSLGLLTSAGSLGIIIPPSIPMIVYAIFSSSAGAKVDIEDLFVAGIGPGLLIGLLLGGYCIVMSRGVAREPFDAKRLADAVLDGVWALFLPVFILGGIYTGVFNATEASAISVVLALVIEIWIHRSIAIRDLPAVLGETSVLMGSILIIVGVAFGFSEFMAMKEVPLAIVDWMIGLELTPISFVLLLNVLLLLVGCLMDIISATILFVPLVAPIAGLCGFDPVHVGLIFIVNLEIGYLTPPLGLNLFVASTYFGKPFGEVIRSVLPFLGILVISLGIVTYVPTVSTGFVNLRNDRPFWSSFPSQDVCEAPESSFGDDEDDDDLLLSDEVFNADGEGDEAESDDEGEKSIQDLMRDPEYQKLLADEAAEDEPEEELDEGFPPEDDEDDDGASIQDLMKDPAYKKALREMVTED
jgi:C4-dicarboxylate transporter, DctM subunit